MLESEIAVLLDAGVTPTDKIYERLGADLPGRDAFGGDLVARGKAGKRGQVHFPASDFGLPRGLISRER
jgi:hypothetical protein